MTATTTPAPALTQRLSELLTAEAAQPQADAVLVRSLKSVRVTAPQVDFGNGTINVWGNPSQDGWVVWYSALDGTDWTPQVTGRLFINNAAGLSARMYVEYADAARRVFAGRAGGTVTSPDNKLHYWTVDLMHEDVEDPVYVRVHVQVEGSAGTYTTVGSSDFIGRF